MCKNLDISILKGKTLTNIEVNKLGENYIRFTDTDNNNYIMFHERDCCEIVYIEDICGDINNLIGSPLTMAECVTKENDDTSYEDGCSITWTFYKLATIKGYVTIRWYGESNGWYSEEVNFGIEEESDIGIDLSKR